MSSRPEQSTPAGAGVFRKRSGGGSNSRPRHCERLVLYQLSYRPKSVIDRPVAHAVAGSSGPVRALVLPGAREQRCWPLPSVEGGCCLWWAFVVGVD